MKDDQARWLERRMRERQLVANQISKAVKAALDSGRRFEVEVKYLGDNIQQRFEQPGDETFTVPSGPPEEE